VRRAILTTLLATASIMLCGCTGSGAVAGEEVPEPARTATTAGPLPRLFPYSQKPGTAPVEPRPQRKPEPTLNQPTPPAGESGQVPPVVKNAHPSQPARKPPCIEGHAGWHVNSVTFRESKESSSRKLGIGNHFDADVSIKVANASNYPIASSGIRLEIRVPTQRYPRWSQTVWYKDIRVQANSTRTLTAQVTSIPVESHEIPRSWALGAGTVAGEFFWQTPQDSEFSLVCGVTGAQSFVVG